jgi:hypothetical protein
MTDYPASNKHSKKNLIEVFNSRKKYRETYVGKEYHDFWHDKGLYGRVTPAGDLILPKKKYLQKIGGNKAKEPIYVVNFVAYAFNNLQKKMKRLYLTGAITDSSPFYDLRPVSGLYPFYANYNKTLKSNHDKFLNNYLRYHRHLGSKANTFHQYVDIFSSYILEPETLLLLTPSSALSSIFVPPAASGLVIEFSAKDEYDKDQQKYDKYISDKSFGLFKEVCLRHGFKVDVNAPWRIVADLGSPAMAEAMEKFNLSIDNLFETAYNTVYQNDYSMLQNFIVNSYNQWVKGNPYLKTVKPSPDGKYRPTVTKRIATTLEKETEEQNNEMWIELYIRTRNIECFRPWEETRVQTMISKAHEMNKYLSLDKALDYVNNELRPFVMTAYDFSFNDEPEPVPVGTGNIVTSMPSGGSTGGSSGY